MSHNATKKGNLLNTRQREVEHPKYMGLKLSGGQPFECSSDWVVVMT